MIKAPKKIRKLKAKRESFYIKVKQVGFEMGYGIIHIDQTCFRFFSIIPFHILIKSCKTCLIRVKSGWISGGQSD